MPFIASCGRRLAPFRPLPVLFAISTSVAFPAMGQDAEPPPEVSLSTVDVVGQSESGTYHPDEVAGAKTDLPMREIPQSVRVVTKKAMDDLGATKLNDVLDYVSGVTRTNNFGGLWDNIAIRGLPGHENTGMSTLVNGFSANRGYNAPRDLAGVERIEFLKGTAAALYGSTEPGGTLNVVSKRPLWAPANAVEGYVGSFGSRRGSWDSTGPIGEDLAYRLNVAAEGVDGFRDYVGAERRVLAPAFTWKLSRDTILEYAGEFVRHATPLDRGVVAVNNRLGAIPRTRFLGEPGDGDVTVENQRHQLILSNEWDPNWRSRIGVSYLDTSLGGFNSQASGTLRPDGYVSRQYYYRNYNSHDTALQAELQGNVRMANVEHEFLFGLETFRFTMQSLALSASPTLTNPYAINIYDPVYGQARPRLGPNTDNVERQRNTAFYVQDAIKLAPDWRLIVGVRADDYQQSLMNYRTARLARQEPSSTSPRAGLSWLASPQWTFYGNAGRSFRPNVGSDFAGTAFSPETSRALELGTKWESDDRRLGASAALFDIRKRNVLTSDPVNVGYSVAAGEVRSRGLEMDLNGQVTRNWRVTANLMLDDVEITRDNTLQVGGPLLNAPKVVGSILAIYEDAFSVGQRYGIGGGLTHVGERLGQARTRAEASSNVAAFYLPAYTTAKLVGYLQINAMLRLTLNIDNLFDTDYYPSSYSRLWVTPGTPRSVTLGMQAKF